VGCSTYVLNKASQAETGVQGMGMPVKLEPEMLTNLRPCCKWVTSLALNKDEITYLV